MALTGPLTTNDGVEHPNAYARISDVNADYDQLRAAVQVPIYHDGTSRGDRAKPVQRYLFLFVESGDPLATRDVVVGEFLSTFDSTRSISEVRSLLYDALKLHPVFEGWSDA